MSTAPTAHARNASFPLSIEAGLGYKVAGGARNDMLKKIASLTAILFLVGGLPGHRSEPGGHPGRSLGAGIPRTVLRAAWSGPMANRRASRHSATRPVTDAYIEFRQRLSPAIPSGHLYVVFGQAGR
jgi:hypothetical protein